MQPILFSQFQQLAMHGNVIPIAESFLADMLTPVAAFMKLCGQEEDGFLLESVEGGENLARYSFLGCCPREQINYVENETEIISSKGIRKSYDDIFSYLKKEFAKYRFVIDPELPRFLNRLANLNLDLLLLPDRVYLQ